uniref:Putative secreted peptide n=1 Tax=Anopheles braziliensis TaxID=58242 RepID=A0A2M3ZQG7_9DIPT
MTAFSTFFICFLIFGSVVPFLRFVTDEMTLSSSESSPPRPPRPPFRLRPLRFFSRSSSSSSSSKSAPSSMALSHSFSVRLSV